MIYCLTMTDNDAYTQELERELAEARRERDGAISASHALRSEFSQELVAHIPEAPPQNPDGTLIDPQNIDLIYDVSTGGARRWAKAVLPTVRLGYLAILNDSHVSHAVRLQVFKRIEDMALITKFADDTKEDETEDLLKKLFAQHAESTEHPTSEHSYEDPTIIDADINIAPDKS